ncbi:MAG: N-acetyltransferase family protein [Pseudomonadota bacterium]
MTLRFAVAADASALAEIYNAIVQAPDITFTTEERSPGDMRAALADAAVQGWPWLVAERSGDVVGYATYKPFRSGPGYARCMEHSIHLAVGARGAGLGRALMDRLQEAALSRGVRVLVAGISGANTTALSFHEALGFETVGRMPEVGEKHGHVFDLVLMQKSLDGAGEAVSSVVRPPDIPARPG